MPLRPVLFLLLAAFGAAGHAACDTGLAERMHAKLHPHRTLDNARAACEPWRGLPGRFIVVLPLPRPSSRSGFTEFDLDVLVVRQADNGNTERATIESRLFQQAALTEDALRIREIRVDTARYLLAKDARAFGLRIAHRAVSRAQPLASETMSLYLPDGPKLTVVLDSLELTLERGEWDSSCSGNFEAVRGSLSVARSTSNGFADLLMRRTRSEIRSTAQGSECVTHEQPAKFTSTVLRYDGTQYRSTKETSSD